MNNSKKRIVWIIAIIFIFSLSREFKRTFREIGLADTLVSLALLSIIVFGIIFWSRTRRKS